MTPGVEKRLYPYVLAAGASLLAAAKPADAGVIYVNPIDQTYTNTSFSLDLNNDGVPDATFNNFGTYGYRKMNVVANGVVGKQIWNWPKASALGAGAWIGPGANFVITPALMAYASVNGSLWGRWANVTDRFLGLRFQIGPNTHYGWVRMDVRATTDPLAIWATVKDWAYEDTPDQGLRAGAMVPEPGTLSLLALGAAGLALWRRRKAQAR